LGKFGTSYLFPSLRQVSLEDVEIMDAQVRHLHVHCHAHATHTHVKTRGDKKQFFENLFLALQAKYHLSLKFAFLAKHSFSHEVSNAP